MHALNFSTIGCWTKAHTLGCSVYLGTDAAIGLEQSSTDVCQRKKAQFTRNNDTNISSDLIAPLQPKTIFASGSVPWKTAGVVYARSYHYITSRALRIFKVDISPRRYFHVFSADAGRRTCDGPTNTTLFSLEPPLQYQEVRIYHGGDIRLPAVLQFKV